MPENGPHDSENLEIADLSFEVLSGTTGQVLRAEDEFGTRVAILEPKPHFSGLLEDRLSEQLNISLERFAAFESATFDAEANDGSLFLALVDCALPGEQAEQAVDYFYDRDIPVIAIIPNGADDLAEDMLMRGAIDYIVRESATSVDYLISLIRRVQRNASMTALVVDSVEARRHYISEQLRRFRLRVMQAADAKTALRLLDVSDNIRLVVTSYKMESGNGAELTSEIRRRFGKDDLSIIGMSASGGGGTSASFIKRGANDFLRTPFEREEFLCRVTQNLDLMEYIQALNAAATRDFLTGLYNRRHFFDVAEPMLMAAQRHNAKPIVAMMDIDHFKSINDTHGHDVGDEVLISVARILEKAGRKTDLVARLGGEEFAVFSPDMDYERVQGIFDGIRKKLADSPIATQAGEIKVTMSIGVCIGTGASLSQMLLQADKMLYEAKSGGRNRVVVTRVERNPAQPSGK